MLYHPQGLYVWDTWYFVQDGRAHCIHLQIPRPYSARSNSEIGALGHAVSDDLLHWSDAGTAIYPGSEGSCDDLDLWTGSVIEREGVFYMYYTARQRSENGRVNRPALATSRDGYNWTRYPDNPIFMPDARWYANEERPIELMGHGYPIVDCRDMCVIFDPDSQGFYCFFAVRRHAQTNAATSVIGLAYSKDLYHWEQRPPCFAPKGLACVEVPDVFFLGGKWRMLCLTGNMYGQRGGASDPLVRRATIYASSDNIAGPYEMDETDNVVLGSRDDQGYSGKTLLWNGLRTLMYTQGEKKAGCPHGAISRPQLLSVNAKGQLRPMWHPACDALYEKTELGGALDVSGGEWGSIGSWRANGDATDAQCADDWAILPFEKPLEDGMLECEITVNSGSAGLCLRVGGDNVMAGGVAVILDSGLGQVILTKFREFPDIEARTVQIERGRKYNLRVAVTGDVFMVYLDGELAIQCFEPCARTGRAALYVERGGARFENIRAFREK